MPLKKRKVPKEKGPRVDAATSLPAKKTPETKKPKLTQGSSDQVKPAAPGLSEDPVSPPRAARSSRSS